MTAGLFLTFHPAPLHFRSPSPFPPYTFCRHPLPAVAYLGLDQFSEFIGNRLVNYYSQMSHDYFFLLP